MRILPVVFLATAPLLAHVGSPDIFFQGDAGPYKLLITIRPPAVVPGVAEVEIRTTSPDVRQIHIVPLRLGFAGQQFPPVADLAQQSKDDPQFYTGALWLMVAGSWQVRIDVDGARGPGRLSVPVPALSTRVLPMQKMVAAGLLTLGLVLAAGIVSIAGAGVREAVVEPGQQPDGRRAIRARAVMAVVAVGVVGVVWFGRQWWGSEESDYMRVIFKPLALRPTVEGSLLQLQLEDPGWLGRRTDDLLPDHGHLMHLYMLRLPDLDLVWHLHPEPDSSGGFTQQLPSMAAGRYALFGDVVHANGLAETATAEIELPDIAGQPLTKDDAAGIWSAARESGLQSQCGVAAFGLPDGVGSERRDVIARQTAVLVPLPRRRWRGRIGPRHGVIYGDAGTCRVRALRPERVCARAPVGVRTDGCPGAYPA